RDLEIAQREGCPFAALAHQHLTQHPAMMARRLLVVLDRHPLPGVRLVVARGRLEAVDARACFGHLRAADRVPRRREFAAGHGPSPSGNVTSTFSAGPPARAVSRALWASSNPKRCVTSRSGRTRC